MGRRLEAAAWAGDGRTFEAIADISAVWSAFRAFPF
jgi:hypothetical protein